MEKKTSEDTRIFYVTTGFLREYLIGNDLELDTMYTHVILDEIHDRDLDTDLMLLLMKVLMLRKSKIKLILMSATLNPTALIEYFAKHAVAIPLIKCKERVRPVRRLFLEDLEERVNFQTNLTFNLEEPKLCDEQLEMLIRLLDYIDQKEVSFRFLNLIRLIHNNLQNY